MSLVVGNGGQPNEGERQTIEAPTRCRWQRITPVLGQQERLRAEARVRKHTPQDEVTQHTDFV